MPTQPESGFEKRQKEINLLWKEHQYLYGIAGLFAGFMIFALFEGISTNFSQTLLNLLPEAIGIGISVSIIDRLYRNLERRRLLHIVKQEILHNLSGLVLKQNENIMLSFKLIKHLANSVSSKDWEAEVELTQRNYSRIQIYAGFGVHVSNLENNMIDHALTSDSIVVLGKSSISDSVTIYDALIELRKEILRRKTIDSLVKEKWKKYINLYSGSKQENYIVEVSYISILLMCASMDENILIWSKTIILMIDQGLSFTNIPKLAPITYDKEEAERIKQEIVTPAEIANLLYSNRL